MKEYKYKINGNSYKVTIGDIEDNIAHVEVNGTHYKVEMEKQPKPVAKPVTVRPMPNAPAAPTQVVKPTAPSTGKSGVKSPLPGVILDIKVNVGDTVKKGQTIIILEAMKMENNINADRLLDQRRHIDRIDIHLADIFVRPLQLGERPSLCPVGPGNGDIGRPER